MASVTLKKIGKQYDQTSVLQDIDLDIKDGEFVVFVGPSGCGKSTLLRMIAGLEDISAGELLIGDTVVNQIPPSKRGIAMVFQSYALYPHMSLYDNMAFGLKIAGKSKSDIDAAVRSAAKVLDIEHLLDRKPRALSGGQRQRVAIGRAITRQPKVFLFDEPLSNLDAALRVQMRLEFARLHAELATTMIYVTHDQIEAMTLADKIVVLAGGRVEQVGSPSELYHHPANQFVAGFIGSPKMNFLNAVVQSADADGVVVRLPGGPIQRATVSGVKNGVTLKQGQNVTLGIRPEHVYLVDPGYSGADQEWFGAKTRALESLGDFSYLYADCDGTDSNGLIIRVDESVRPRNGDLLQVAADPAKCHLFDEHGIAFPRLAGTQPGQAMAQTGGSHTMSAPVTV